MVVVPDVEVGPVVEARAHHVVPAAGEEAAAPVRRVREVDHRRQHAEAPAAGPGVALEVELGGADAAPGQESGLGVEVVAEAGVLAVDPPAVVQPGRVEVAAGVVALQPRRLGLRQEPHHRERRVRRQRHVHRVGAVEAGAVGLGAVDEEAADPGAREEVPPVARHQEVLAGAAVGPAGLHVHDRNVVPSRLPRQSSAAQDRDALAGGGDADPAAEEQVDQAVEGSDGAHVELTRVLQEEVPLLGVEEWEAGQVDLFVVHFRLGEVGVDGHVQVEARRDSVLEIETRVGLEGAAGRAPFQHAAAAAGRERSDPQVQSSVQASHPVQAAGQADARDSVGLRHRRPEGLLVLAPDVAHDVEAPALGVGVGKAKGDQGNGDLGHPAVGADPSRHVPHSVPVPVDVGRGHSDARALAFVEDLLVQLRAQRVGREHVRRARVLEGVQHDLDVVFLQDALRVPPHLGGGEGVAGPVVGGHAQVEGLGVVEDPHLGALARGRSLVGLLLHERRRQPGGAPCGLVQHAVQARRLGGGRRVHLVQAPVRLGAGGGRPRKESGGQRHGDRHGRRRHRRPASCMGHVRELLLVVQARGVVGPTPLGARPGDVGAPLDGRRLGKLES